MHRSLEARLITPPLLKIEQNRVERVVIVQFEGGHRIERQPVEEHVRRKYLGAHMMGSTLA